MESPSRNTSCLTKVYYIAVYVKDPPMPNLSSWIRLPSWAFTDLTPGIDLQGSGYLSRPVGIRLLVPGLDIFHLDQQQLGRSVGHMPSPPSVGHPGLPESDHVDGIPMKYIHNSSPRSSPRFTVLPSSSACACTFILWSERITENLEGLPNFISPTKYWSETS